MMNRTPSMLLFLGVLLLVQSVCAPLPARADDVQASNPQGSGIQGNNIQGDPLPGRQRFSLTVDSHFGYDDNPNGLSDTSTVAIINPATGRVIIDPRTGEPRTRNVDLNSPDSAFLNFSVGASYTAASPRLSLTAGVDVGVNYFFDRAGRSYDVNGGLSLHLAYKVSPRMRVEASTYDAYIPSGDYGATSLTNFNGQFAGGTRTPGTTVQQDSDYFYTSNFVSVSYQFTARLAAVVSDTIAAFAYTDEPYANDQDRIENDAQLEINYRLLPTLALAADYRFGYIDYFGVDNDSYTNFALVGLDYTFNPRLHGSFRAGAEFRAYFDAAGDETSPYFEGTLNYDLNHRSQLSFLAHYGIEEGDLSASNSKSDTLRVGFNLDHTFTSRLTGYVGFYYAHSFFSTPVADATTRFFDANGFDEDTFDVAIGARLAINRRISADIGYTHTTVLSQVNVREYERNRIFAGLRLAY